MAIMRNGNGQSAKIENDNYAPDNESVKVSKADMMTPKDTGLADKAPYAKGGMK